MGDYGAPLSRSDKAYIEVEDGDTLYVMYNPREYTYTTRLSDFGSAGSGDEDDDSFVEENAFLWVSKEDFVVELFYDTYEDGTSVKDETDLLQNLQKPTVQDGSIQRPPLCTFVWEEFSYFGLVKEVEQKFTMFLSDGTPVRAEVRLVMEGVFTDDEESTYTALTESRKLWTIKAGERLDMIAYQVYQDPALWPILASANGIEKPLLFPRPEDIGKELVIPHLD